MKIAKLRALILVLPMLFAGSGGAEPQAQSSPAPAATEARMNMLQLMRAFPFPHANVLFDAQSRDPEGDESRASMSYSVYRWHTADVYAGWAGVENSALALTEMAPLLLTPRLCANGNRAPVERDDWKAAVEQLAAAGRAAYDAARTKSLDAMVDVSQTITDACSACHDPYRDVDLEGGQRCGVPK